jgi:hypothetical protein
MRNIKHSGQRIPTNSAAQVPQAAASKPTPAVPIAIYRELSADLKATQTTIANLQSENLQLAEQNQQLRQELETLAAQTQQVAQRFRQSAIAQGADEALMLDELGFDSESAVVRSQMLDQLYRAMPDYAPVAPLERSPFESTPGFNLGQVKRQVKRKLAATQAHSPLKFDRAASDAELSGWKLTLVMGLIVLSAFGAGFLIVRPLMAPANSR